MYGTPHKPVTDVRNNDETPTASFNDVDDLLGLSIVDLLRTGSNGTIVQEFQ